MSEPEFSDALQSVLDRSNERRKETVRGLVRVLQQMADQGVKVFTIAVVGRECEAQGILKTQTTRNETGADFRLLIEAFARLKGGETKHVPRAHASPLDEAIARISDFETRNRLKAIAVIEHIRDAQGRKSSQ